MQNADSIRQISQIGPPSLRKLNDPRSIMVKRVSDTSVETVRAGYFNNERTSYMNTCVTHLDACVPYILSRKTAINYGPEFDPAGSAVNHRVIDRAPRFIQMNPRNTIARASSARVSFLFSRIPWDSPLRPLSSARGRGRASLLSIPSGILILCLFPRENRWDSFVFAAPGRYILPRRAA